MTNVPMKLTVGFASLVLVMAAGLPGTALSATTGTTERVSVDSAGKQANGLIGAGAPAISADGRYAAFDSDASNLVARDTNGVLDIFVRDQLGSAVDNSIVMHLEEPVAGSIYSGVSNLRGWAIAPVAIDHVELLVDGGFVANVPSGGFRPDVAAAYPTYPSAAQSGFSMAFNYSELSAGAHTVTVRAVTGSGGFKTDTATFNVTRFPSPFISNPAAVTLAGASCSHDSNAPYLDHLMVQGMPYDLTLRWRTATQGWPITNIAE